MTPVWSLGSVSRNCALGCWLREIDHFLLDSDCPGHTSRASSRQSKIARQGTGSYRLWLDQPTPASHVRNLSLMWRRTEILPFFLC